LELAQRAAGIEPLEAAVEQRARELGNAQNEEAKAETAVADRTREVAAAEEHYRNEQLRAPELNAARAEQTRLEGLRERVSQLATARTQHAEQVEGQQKAERAREAAGKEVAQLQATREKQQTRLQADQALGDQMPGLRLAAQEATRLLTRREKLETHRAEALQKDQELKKQEQAHAKAAAARDEVANEVARLEQAWQRGQAAILAQELAEGHPCPVCGSAEHPAPAHSVEELPTETALKQQRKKRDEAERKVTDAREASIRLEGELRHQEELCAALELELGDQARQTPSLLKEAEQEANRRLTLAEQAAQRAAELAPEIQETGAKRDAAEKEATRCEAAYQQATAEVQGALLLIQEREQGIAPELQDAVALEAAISAVIKLVAELTDALETATVNQQNARTYLAAAIATHEAQSKARAEAETYLQEAQTRLADGIRQAGFPDQAAYQNARRSAETLAELDTTIRKYDAEVQSATDRLHRAKANASGLTAPDLPVLEQASLDGEAAHAAAIRGESDLRNEVANLERVDREVQAVGETLRAQEEEHRLVGGLSEIANGDNSKRLTFQRYVLSTILEGVLVSASERLQRMSKGQFSLHRKTDPTDARRHGGLDLEVFDTHTGKYRDVSTLSGGEGFLASLSLALGLADFVQQYAGGIHLETIFVDEGFGSLDPETLDLAMEVLFDLQAGGRLVGIISHVEDLKTCVTARLEVTRDSRGSHAQFVC
jgi:exonuclease SbcC